MNDSPEPTPPPLILSYANPRGGQPLNSRFVCKYHDDGISLTEPPKGKKIMDLFGGPILTLVGIGMFGCYLTDTHDVQVSLLVTSLLVTASGVLATLAATFVKQKSLVIRAGRNGLVVIRPDFFSRRLRWRKRSIRCISVSEGAIDIGKLSIGHHVTVTGRLYLARHIVSNRPKDECQWIAYELRQALGLPQMD